MSLLLLSVVKKIKCQRCWLFKSHHAGRYYESHQPQWLDPAAICSLNKWKVILCTPRQRVHKRSLFICSLPKPRSLDASFHQLMKVKGEHDESNGALVLHGVKHSESILKIVNDIPDESSLPSRSRWRRQAAAARVPPVCPRRWAAGF